MLSQYLKKYQQLYFETPADGGVGQAPVQTPTGAQGQAQGSEGFWNLFPNVPQEHRALLEPHIREMQGHVTRLEEQLTPFKSFTDSGVDPQTAAGLIRFNNDFMANPLEMWVRMGSMLQQQQGQDGRPIVDPEVDLEYLAALARGEDPDADAADQAGGLPVGQQPQGGAGEGQLLQQMQQRIEQLQNELEQDRTQRQTAVQDIVLDRRMAQMRDALKQAGYPEDLLTDDEMHARIIAYRGDFQAATKSFLDHRAGILKGFTDQRNNGPKPLEMNNGTPPVAPREEVRGRDAGDPFARARPKAMSRIRRENRTTAQEG